jgi:hypothetical protein
MTKLMLDGILPSQNTVQLRKRPGDKIASISFDNAAIAGTLAQRTNFTTRMLATAGSTSREDRNITDVKSRRTHATAAFQPQSVC